MILALVLGSLLILGCSASPGGEVEIVRINGDKIQCQTVEWVVLFGQLSLSCWAGEDKTWSYLDIPTKQIKELRWRKP